MSPGDRPAVTGVGDGGDCPGRTVIGSIVGMRTRRLPAALAALSVAAAVGACAAPDAQATPDGAAVPTLAWEECGDGVDCATLAVPVDHADPDGPTLDLALVRHRAEDPERRIGSLLYNPGGPGAPAGDAVRASGTPGVAPFSAEVLARFDVVGMDPRGVGGSTGVACLDDAEREELLAVDNDPTLPGGAPRDVLDTRARELAEACAAAVDPAVLPHLATDDVARDMDLVRVALAEEEISYLGQSYGTLLGATYATLFPDRVRQMVLDAPVDPLTWQTDPLGASQQQARAGEDLLDAWFDTCRAEGPQVCGFGGDDPEAAFDALVDRLERDPLPVPATPPIPAGQLDGATTLLAARTAAFRPEFWPILTAGLLAAEAGDGSVLGRLATALVRDPDGTPNALGEANLAVNCLDRAVPADPAAHDADAAATIAAAPRFGEVSAYLWLACTHWPAANPDRFTGPYTGAGAPPALVIGGRVDSQTPYAWAESMASELEGAVLLTRDGYGHGSVGVGLECVEAAVDRALVDGVLPAPGTTCPGPPATTAPITAG